MFTTSHWQLLCILSKLHSRNLQIKKMKRSMSSAETCFKAKVNWWDDVFDWHSPFSIRNQLGQISGGSQKTIILYIFTNRTAHQYILKIKCQLRFFSKKSFWNLVCWRITLWIQFVNWDAILNKHISRLVIRGSGYVQRQNLLIPKTNQQNYIPTPWAKVTIFKQLTKFGG